MEFYGRARLVKLSALVRETTLDLVAFLLGATAAVDVLRLKDEGLAEWRRVGHRCRRAKSFSPDAADTDRSLLRYTCTITEPNHKSNSSNHAQLLSTRPPRHLSMFTHQIRHHRHATST